MTSFSSAVLRDWYGIPLLVQMIVAPSTMNTTNHLAVEATKLANEAIEKLLNGDRYQGIQLMTKALSRYESVEDDQERHDALSPFVTILGRSGFADLALITALDILEISQRAGAPKQIANDLPVVW